MTDPATPSELIALGPQAMLDGICDAVVVGMEGGEQKIHVTIQRAIERDDGNARGVHHR